MARLRRRFRLRTLGVVLAAVLLLPLMARGHAHGPVKPASCAACVATQHSPGLVTPVVAWTAPAFRAVRLADRAVEPCPPAVVRPHDGRGPPAPLPTRFI